MVFDKGLLEAVHKLCNSKGGEGSAQALPYRFSLIKVNQSFDRICYMRGRGMGVKNRPFWHYITYGQPLRGRVPGFIVLFFIFRPPLLKYVCPLAEKFPK